MIGFTHIALLGLFDHDVLEFRISGCLLHISGEIGYVFQLRTISGHLRRSAVHSFLVPTIAYLGRLLGQRSFFATVCVEIWLIPAAIFVRSP
jgi:hypothetical protein